MGKRNDRNRSGGSGRRDNTSRRRREPEATRSSPASGREAIAPGVVGSRKFLIQLACVCTLAFFLRMLHVLQTFEVPTVVRLLGDARGYWDWALSIADGDWLGNKTFYQAPLYPYFLAVLIKCLGPSVTGVRVVQSLLGVAGVALMGLAGRRMFNARVGVIAAAMLAAYPPAIYYDGIIQKASLASVLLCGLLAACAALQDRKQLWLAVLAGVLLGLLVITRENALLWVPILPVWIVLAIHDRPLAGRLKLVAGCSAGIAMILLSVAARNAHFGGEWSPSTFQAGPNFYIGNNLHASGIYQPLVPGHETPMYERADAQRLAEQAEGRMLSPREVSKHWMQRSFREIGEDPVRWGQLMVTKTLMVLNRYEVPDVDSMHVFRAYSKPLSLLRPWHFGVLFPLGAWGLVASRGRWRHLWLFYLLTASMVAAVVLFFILGRYRLPVAVLLMPFAAAGIADLVARLRRSRRQAAVSIALIACVGVVSNLPVHEESTLNASSLMNAGIAAGQNGDLVSSIRWLELAVDAFPESVEANFNLGRAYSLSGQPAGAIEAYRSAIHMRPDIEWADFYAGQAFEKMGDRQNAALHYRRALQLNPQDQRAAQGLARLVER